MGKEGTSLTDTEFKTFMETFKSYAKIFSEYKELGKGMEITPEGAKLLADSMLKMYRLVQVYDKNIRVGIKAVHDLKKENSVLRHTMKIMRNTGTCCMNMLEEDDLK